METKYLYLTVCSGNDSSGNYRIESFLYCASCPHEATEKASSDFAFLHGTIPTKSFAEPLSEQIKRMNDQDMGEWYPDPRELN